MNQFRLPAVRAVRAFAHIVILAFAGSSAFTANAQASAITWSENGAVSLSESTYTVSQAAGSATVTAVRKGGTHGAISVSYVYYVDSAIAGQEIAPESGKLDWADGDASNKTFEIPVSTAKAFTGTEKVVVRLTAGPNTILGAHTSATVDIVGGGGSAPPVSKSIRGWVSCNESIDESTQLEVAIAAAANNAFILLIDCPVRFHTGAASTRSIPVPDGVTISFSGAGEFLIADSGPAALMVANPARVTFLDWNVAGL